MLTNKKNNYFNLEDIRGQNIYFYKGPLISWTNTPTIQGHPPTPAQLTLTCTSAYGPSNCPLHFQAVCSILDVQKFPTCNTVGIKVIAFDSFRKPLAPSLSGNCLKLEQVVWNHGAIFKFGRCSEIPAHAISKLTSITFTPYHSSFIAEGFICTIAILDLSI